MTSSPICQKLLIIPTNIKAIVNVKTHAKIIRMLSTVRNPNQNKTLRTISNPLMTVPPTLPSPSPRLPFLPNPTDPLEDPT